MGFSFCLGLAIASIIFFIGYFYFGIRSYKKRFNIPFDIRNTFPYEIGYNTKFLDNIGVNALLILSMVSSLSLFLYYGYGHSFFESSKIVTIIAGILLSIITFFAFFADLKYIRFHLLMVVLLALSAFMLPSGIVILGYVSFQNTNDILSIVVAGLALVVALFIFSSLMNPKLNFRLNMKKATDKDGKEILVRPKYFVIAFSEWLYIFSLFIDQILLIILIIPR